MRIRKAIMKVDVIIPVYKPQKRFLELIGMLEKQTIAPDRIILMNTEKNIFEAFCSIDAFLAQHKTVQLHHLTKETFDHGATRNAGVAFSDADYFI